MPLRYFENQYTDLSQGQVKYFQCRLKYFHNTNEIFPGHRDRLPAVEDEDQGDCGEHPEAGGQLSGSER